MKRVADGPPSPYSISPFAGAHTPHFDGGKKSDKEPVVIAICGVDPIKFHKVDEGRPSWMAL